MKLILPAVGHFALHHGTSCEKRLDLGAVPFRRSTLGCSTGAA